MAITPAGAAGVAEPGSPARSRAHRDRGAPGTRQRSEGVAGFLFIAVPMLAVPGAQHRRRPLRRVHQRLELEPPHRPVSFIGLKNYQNALSDPTFQHAIQNVDLLRGPLGPADDGRRACSWRSSSTRSSAAGRSSAPRSTSRPSRAPPRSRRCGSSSRRPTACSTSSGRRWDSTRSSSSSASRPTRTGSATRAPRCNR